MNPDAIHEIPDDLKALIGQVLVVNQYDLTTLTAIWTHAVTLQGAKGVLAIAQFGAEQSIAVINIPIVVMPVYGKIINLGEVMQLLTVISEIPSAQYAFKDNILFFTLCLPLHSFYRENLQAVFDSLLSGVETVRANLLAAIRHFYEIKPPEELTYPEPVLPNIKMTPKEMQVVYGVLTKCNQQIQAIYTFLMEKWAKAGYLVTTTAHSIVLDSPYGNRTTRLAMLMPGLSAGLAALQPAVTAHPPTIILFWESLRKRQGFSPENIDVYQSVVKKISALHITESSAHIEMGNSFDMKSAQALLKAMKTLAQSVRSDEVEAPATSGLVTPDNIQLTLAACPENVQAIYKILVDGWKTAGGTVQCASAGRIYLKMKTKAHRSGNFAQFPRNFNLAVLAAPAGKKPANMQVGWDLSRSQFAAYLDCIPDMVDRFESLVRTLPGFEIKGTITYLWMSDKFQIAHAESLLNAFIGIKNAEQDAL